MGNIPTTIATLVIKIGLMRSAADSLALSKAFPVWSRRCSALVINKTELAMDTPTDMMMPIYDCRLSVDPVIINATSDPSSTAGTVDKTTSDTLKDWKLAASI